MGWDNNVDSYTVIILYVCNGTEKIPPLELGVLIIPAPSIRSQIPDDAIMKSKKTFGTGTYAGAYLHICVGRRSSS